MGLTDSVVIVTGAGSGIGLETARLFAMEDANVVLADIQEDRLQTAKDEVSSDNRGLLAVPTDVSKRDDVEQLVKSTFDRFGRVDILVNNAGYGYGATIEQTSEAEFEDLWRTNVMSVLFGMQAVLPIMRKQGSGHIISIASAAGKIAYPGIGAYSATKHAIVALTDSLRAEVADVGIHASVVLPIGTETKFFREAHLEPGASVGPHGPVQSPEHVARKIVACAKHPTAEVLPYKPLRLGVAIKGIMPSIIDAIGRRSFRGQSAEEQGPASMTQQQEAEHGEA